MAKLLRILVVVLLVISAAAAALEIVLFLQRQQLKGRTRKLENAVVAFAGKLTTKLPEDKSHLTQWVPDLPATIDRQKLKTYTNMDEVIGMVTNLAQARYDQLVAIAGDLSTTRDELASTKATLADTQQKLQLARDEIAGLKTTIEQKDAQIAEARQKIATLDTEIAGLKEKITGLDAQVAKLKEEKADMTDKLARAELRLRVMGAKLGESIPVPEGLTGHVLAVNSTWNFVVLDIGLESRLLPNVEMLVHRGDQLVGKIRVTSCSDRVSIADILRDWPQSQPITEGDKAFFSGT